jgi:hypothetical protein
MRFSTPLLAIAALFTTAYAAPTPQHQHGQAASKSPMPAGMNMAASAAPPSGASTVTPGKPQCEYSFFEKSNLGHNHDVNTGKIKAGSTVSPYAPAILGSGCSPAWAVGGAIDDETPTKTPGDLKLSLWGGIA